MAEVTHWADIVADEVSNKHEKNVVATGITPSGHIHIGNMREVVTADAVYKSLNDKMHETTLIYLADNFDPLRKVYPFLPEHYSKYVGNPISEIPCPCGECSNYAEHFVKPFLVSMEKLGIEPKVYRADELYKSGYYTEAIKDALVNKDNIAKILTETSGREPKDEWSPFNAICRACGKMTSTKVISFDVDKETVDYICECGFSGSVSMQGGGKLNWRVDWPARWKILGVTVEPFGKDHASRGGSYDTGKRIAKEIFNYEPPYPIVYEWIMLANKGAMSSSTGIVVSIDDMLKVVPPEVLRYLIIKTKPEKHINFDPSIPLLTLIDEYEKLKTMEIEKISTYNKRLLDLSKATGICHTNIPFKHMVTIYQVAHGDSEKILEILERVGYETGNRRCIQELINNVQNWLEMYAPPYAKFSVKETLPAKASNLNKVQRAFLCSLAKIISTNEELSGEQYHNLVYQAKEKGSVVYKDIVQILNIYEDELAINPKDLFKAIYIATLGTDSGPKAGWFLSSLDRNFLISRFTEAAGDMCNEG